jgi:hypothetical protein
MSKLVLTGVKEGERCEKFEDYFFSSCDDDVFCWSESRGIESL